MAKMCRSPDIYPVFKVDDIKQLAVDDELVHVENGACTKI
jgi:hypothetical protein